LANFSKELEKIFEFTVGKYFSSKISQLLCWKWEKIFGGNDNICKEPQPWIGMQMEKNQKKTSKLVG
jgi:hypothetical protein